jgi:signal transduction histidine kinase
MPIRRSVLSGPAAGMVAAAVLTVAGLVEAGYGAPDATVTPATVAGALALGAATLVAWWAPLPGVVLLGLFLAVPTLLADLPPAGGAHLITSMLLVGWAAYRCPTRTGLAAYAAGAGVPAVTIVFAGETVWELLFYPLILGPAWLVGYLLRREQARSDELARLAEALRIEREKQAEVAVAAERTRISRELHDAVAHTVSVMTLQVGVVRRRLDHGIEEQTLRGAEELGRQAVDELRRIVGLVRQGEGAALAPLPSMAHLQDLVDRVRATGTTVVLAVTGDLGRLPQALDMSAYRIVQEALTNALRHAPGADVTVRVASARDTLALEVRNGAPRGGAPMPERDAGGHGLVGMRERAALFGARLEAGPEAGGYAVRVALPVAAAAVSA